MESPEDISAHRHVSDRQLSRRSLLGCSVAAFAGAAGLLTACTTHDENASGGTHDENASGGTHNENDSRGRVLFEDVFAGNSLSREHWNPYICDSNSHGWPWLMQPSVAVPSSATVRAHGYNLAYDLPSAIRVDDGLTLSSYRGTRAAGYSWTGSVMCSNPTSNNFGSGTVHTAGFTFADARVEVRAKMPDLTSGQWPSIWCLPASDGQGPEIDLFEGGFLSETIHPNQLMAVHLFTSGNHQQLLDCGTDLSAAYHTYAMEYRQGSSIKLFFDDSHVYTYTHNVPVGRYFLIMTNGIASANAVHWHTQVSNSTPAINLLRVAYVRVRAL